MKPIAELYSKSFRILFFDELSDYKQTISDLTEKLETKKNTNAYNNLGIAYFEIGQYEEALTNLNASIELNDKNGIAYINRAELYKKWNKLGESESDYGKAIELNPKDATFWRCRAYLRKEKGELINALSDFKRAKRIEPRFQPTRIEIKELEKELGIEGKSWIDRLKALFAALS